MEPLSGRQIEALRKASGISTFKIFLDMNDFMLDLATKSGRREERKSWPGSFTARRESNRDPLQRLVRFEALTGS